MMRHDTYTDGKSGPWLRRRHRTRPGTELLVVDNHCGRCQTLVEKLLTLESNGRPAYGMGEVTVREAERLVGS